MLENDCCLIDNFAPMKKFLLFFIAVVMLGGCKKELVSEPNNLISKEKMVDIMYDLSLLEGMKVQNAALLDSFKNNSNEYIYKKYKIDSLQFAQSNMYYAANYKEYEKMYNQVKAKIDKDKLEITSLIKSQAKKDSLVEITKKKLKLKKEADSIKRVKLELKLKKETDSVKKANQLKASKSSDALKKAK